MGTELTTKVRLVRCPKCQKLLPELPEFNLYKCGGCGTTLQAKRGVKDDRSRASILSDMDADKINQPVHASEEKESTSPSNKDTLSDSGECSLHENNGRDQHTSSGDSDADEQLGGTISSRKDKDQDNGGDQKNNFSDCKTHRPEVTNEACSSTEFAHDKNEEIADNQNDIYPNEKVETAHNGNGEFSHGMIEESLPFGGRCLEEAENDENAPLSDINTTEINEKLDSDFRNSSAVNLVATVANGPTASADHKPVKESISTDVVVSSPGEQLLQTQSVNHDSVHVKTAEAWISTEFDPSSKFSDAVKNMNKSPTTTDLLVPSPIEQLVQNQSLIHDSSHMKTVEARESSELDVSAEFIGAVKNMIKSPTTRSAHAYDGSVSSFDEMDDNSFQDAYKVTHSVHSEEKPRRDKFLVKSSMSTDSEMQRQQQNSWSEKRNYAMNKSKWDPDEYLQSTRQSRVSPNWSGSERDEYDPRKASHPLGTRPHYEYGGPSNQLHDRFHRHSSYQSSDWPEDSEQDKMKLMRMIFELQDQVNKTLFLQGNGTNGVPGLSRKVSHNPRYHNNQAFGEEVFPPLNYPGYLGRCGVGSSCSEQRRYTQMPFSGETSRSHQLNSCLHCCPQDRPFSAQLPPFVPRKNDKLYKIHPGQSYYTSFSSCPSSPQQSLDSELPHWGRETKFDDRRWKSQEMRNYNLVKRHFRPLAGAAPFITCYNCFHLLHLPADFLLFKRKIHRLRCGACSEVLKFSLQNQYHIVPYTLRAIDPPENLVNDYNEAADRRILASSSEANDYSHADPGSYSDDYDQSHYKSCSTEGDPASFTPSHNLQGSLDDRKVQYSSFGPAKDIKDIFSRQPQNNYRQPVLRYQSAGTSSGAQRLVKLSSEIEDLKQRSSSPLHRLLGYSSPTDLLYVSRPGQEKTAQSAETRLKAVKDD